MNRSAAAESVKPQGAQADRSRPPEQSPETIEALQNFRIIFRAVRRHFHEVEERCGISGSQLWALSVVVQSPGIRVKDLARSMAVQQSTASNLVEQLVRQGLIRRARESADQRIVQLYPTEAGEDAIARAPKPLVGILPDVLSRLEPKRLVTLNRLLDEIVRSMRTADRSARHTPLADL
ncbi:MAG: winged helix-turn-helix transcriptional regulator [Burkholderiaceae bacterium]|nr:winged helix-turn-helix transcriptional regulator [Burkholderiaceae bacterium]